FTHLATHCIVSAPKIETLISSKPVQYLCGNLCKCPLCVGLRCCEFIASISQLINTKELQAFVLDEWVNLQGCEFGEPDIELTITRATLCIAIHIRYCKKHIVIPGASSVTTIQIGAC